MRAEERKKKADANAALEHWKAQLIERYNEDMASYKEECATLAADGVPKKFWPKKPTHPTRGRKAINCNHHHSILHLLLYLLLTLTTLLPLPMSL
jgi:hypothetical protein